MRNNEADDVGSKIKSTFLHDFAVIVDVLVSCACSCDPHREREREKEREQAISFFLI